MQDLPPVVLLNEYQQNVNPLNGNPAFNLQAPFGGVIPPSQEIGSSIWNLAPQPTCGSSGFQLPSGEPSKFPGIAITNHPQYLTGVGAFPQLHDSWGMFSGALPGTQDPLGYVPAPVDLNYFTDLDFSAPIPLTPITQQTFVAPDVPNVFPCPQIGCSAQFKRPYERARHEIAVHGSNPGTHLCPVAGCPKGRGVGYSRADKVKEHLWKKHAHLGYTKSR